MEATVSEIHRYPLRPEGYAEPLFCTDSLIPLGRRAVRVAGKFRHKESQEWPGARERGMLRSLEGVVASEQ